MNKLYTAQEIYDYLDQYVIGQREAKKVLAYTGYMHQKRFHITLKNKDKVEELKELKEMKKNKEKISECLPIYIKELQTAVKTLKKDTDAEIELDAVLLKYMKKEFRRGEDLEEQCKITLAGCKRDLKEYKKEIEKVSNKINKLNPGMDYSTKKSNALIIGPSGCGKTYLIEKLGELLDVPVVLVDCTQITAKGWSGQDIDSYVKQASESSHEHKDATIFFFDEFDKICMPAIGKGGSDHNKQAQFGFLKLLESVEYTVEEDSNRSSSLETINSANFLYIFGGNFEYIRKEDKRRLETNNIGYVEDNSHKEEILNESISAKLQKNNVAREIAGRISLMASVENLTKEQLRSVLLEAKDNIYREYQAITGLTLCEEDIEYILTTCIKNKTGARGLRSAIDQLILGKTFPEGD